ncbi:MAG: FAD-dependent oxidoreductase [Candidatus Rokuibacteriota bacterium]|nr:MAG: FAD-dependent oxidoreductase [Candidatus Rokubacteria bacterium]
MEPPWWLQEAPPDSLRPPLEGESRADVAIVGGGYTGLWTALALKERNPAAEVVVLEAEFCGFGPSGRNGGFLETYWAALPRLRDRLGDRDALAVARASEAVVGAVRALGEDVWLRESGMLLISASPAQDAEVERAVLTAQELGVAEEAVPLSSSELEARVRSARFRRGVFYPKAATVQPARLVRALRRRALQAGVRLHERAKATRIRSGSVETPSARVVAPEVVVATNAWAAGWRPLARCLTPFGSYVVLTEPVPDRLAEIGWTGGEAIADGRMFLHYFRTTADGRVLMGSGSGPIGFGGRIDGRFSDDRPTAARAEAGLRTLLPTLADARISHSWGGPVDVSADHLPLFGTVPGTRIHYGAGYTGNGVGPSWLGGQILASLALGADDEWTRLPLIRRRVQKLPPEPVNYLGGSLVRRAMLSVEEAEEAGRRPAPGARLVASLPRRLGLRVGTR